MHYYSCLKRCDVLPVVLLIALSALSLLVRESNALRIMEVFKERGKNSNITTLSKRLGVRPTLRAPKIVWKLAYNIQKKVFPLLYLFDPLKPKNLNVCLDCLWWKAASSRDKKFSVLYDDYLSYDMLPRFTRCAVLLIPRLHRTNVEIRTAYIDQAIHTHVAALRKEEKQSNNESLRIRLVTFGTGYDVRSIRLCSTQEHVIDEAYELDRQEITSTKQKMMERLLLRRQQRQKHKRGAAAVLSSIIEVQHLPTLIGVDLNDTNNVQIVLRDILGRGSSMLSSLSTTKTPRWHTIFLFEGVMIYLDKGVPTELLRICSSSSSSSSLVFADRLENLDATTTTTTTTTTNGDATARFFDTATRELGKVGWKLEDWCQKPGLARHMGMATNMHT